MGCGNIRKVFFIFLFFILFPIKNVFSGFKDIKKVTFSTAYTLEKKESVVGIFSPFGYGITERITIFTHPLLHLLLTPNLWLRWQLIHSDVSFSLTSGYIETFLDPKKLDFPGSAQFGGIISIALTRWSSLSFLGGYVLNVSPISHASNFGSSFNVLLTPANLFTLQAHSNYNFTKNSFQTPTIIIMWTRLWEIIRFSCGVAIGKFPLQIDSIKELYVYPILDLWWQF